MSVLQSQSGTRGYVRLQFSWSKTVGHGERRVAVWCLWSAKGGVGCSVVAAASALLMSRRREVLLVDLSGGDVSTMLGIEPETIGVVDWLAVAGPPIDALARMEVSVTDGLFVLPWQGHSTDLLRTTDQLRIGADDHDLIERFRILAAMLVADHRLVVVDLGDLGRRDDPLQPRFRDVVRDGAGRNTLVTRLCYPAVVAALSHPRPDDVVIVVEPGRSLRSTDVQLALGGVEVSTVRWDPAIARAVDAGLLEGRLPRPLHRLPIHDELLEGATW